MGFLFGTTLLFTCFLSFITVITGAASFTHSKGQILQDHFYLRSKKNTTSSVIEVNRAVSRTHCVVQCTHLSVCMSIFYNQRNGICQLHSVTFDITDTDTNLKGVQYYSVLGVLTGPYINRKKTTASKRTYTDRKRTAAPKGAYIDRKRKRKRGSKRKVPKNLKHVVLAAFRYKEKYPTMAIVRNSSKVTCIKLYFNLKYVTALEYIPSAWSYIMSGTSKIYKYDIRPHRGNRLKKFGARSLSVDAKRRIVFISVMKSGFIARMTPKGERYRVITAINMTIAISVDPKRQRVIICTHEKVHEITYDGKLLKELMRGNKLGGLTINPEGPVLYIVEDKTIFMLQVIPKAVTKLMTYDVTPNAIHYHNGYIYVSLPESGDKKFRVVSLELDSNTTQLVDMKTTITNGVLFCTGRISFKRN